ncbi:MAG: Ig-like domain-containing protein [Bacteroidetes bacterium]|nr:Ig-like domain-containing protein [Bacteroidota bacterium]
MKTRLLILAISLVTVLLAYNSCKKDSTENLDKLVEITVFPGDTVIPIGSSLQFHAIGLFDDSTLKDITGSVTWSASPKGKVTITGGGLATAVDTGKTYIVAAGGPGVVGGSICTASNSATTARAQIIQLYESDYLGSNLNNCGWTGNVAGCDAGGVSANAHTLVVKRIDYFRKMVGLPGDVSLDDTKNSKCQKAALIMKANNDLSHFPPNTWTCWTVEGNDAAGNSNIALGMHSVNAVTGYMDDFGANNTVVGHRRWLIYSKGKYMGDGSTDNSNAIWVMGNSSNPMPSNMPEFIAWPPKGYVPAELPFDRWSFGIPDADFSAVTVTMKDGAGQNVTLTVISKTDNGYGDNTVVWEPDGINTTSANDVSYTVTINNVKVSTQSKTFTYTVTLVQTSKTKSSDYIEMKRHHPEWRIL